MEDLMATIRGALDRIKSYDRPTLTVTKVEYTANRTLIHGHTAWGDHFVIAKPGTEVKAGDIVEYKPCGRNFGWFKGVVK